MEYGIGMALILALWGYISTVVYLSPGLAWHEPIIAGAVTGFIVGDVELGLYIGGNLMLMSLGMHTYGGATIPDFHTGAILGTAFGALGSTGAEAGLAIAIPAAMLMTQLDVLGRATNTILIHKADKYIEKGNWKGMTLMHLIGQLPWGLTRAIPIFLALLLGQGPVERFSEWSPEWFMNGMETMGAVLPALGFALLLSQLPVKKHFPFLILGFVLFAYLEVPIIGIAIGAIAITTIYTRMKAGEQNA
ncbi:MAG: PTS mannose/fructose/sorbose/N-acetylgalactosamine transporter subunit IIC [Halanaerobiales bacterium]